MESSASSDSSKDKEERISGSVVSESGEGRVGTVEGNTADLMVIVSWPLSLAAEDRNSGDFSLDASNGMV